MGKTRKWLKLAKKVMKKLKGGVEKKGLKWSVTKNGKKGKRKMIALCGYLEEELRQCSKEEGVTMANSVETLGVDLRARVKRLGVKQKARRKKCKVRLSLIKKKKALPVELHEGGGQEQQRAKKSTTSWSLFMEAFGFEVERELSPVQKEFG